MNYQITGKQQDIAIVLAAEGSLYDGQSALDILMTARYETGCDKLIFQKSCFNEDFFMLRSGIAGEILQKFINYKTKVAIIGDFSRYQSKPLRDFFYESNQGNDVFFLPTIDEAVRKLEVR